MSLSCHEIVVFRAASGVSSRQLADALTSVDALIRAQPGFVSRATMYDPEQLYWIDNVEWDSRSNAMQALEQLQNAPLAAALFSVIDPESVLMLHGHDAAAGLLLEAT